MPVTSKREWWENIKETQTTDIMTYNYRSVFIHNTPRLSPVESWRMLQTKIIQYDVTRYRGMWWAELCSASVTIAVLTIIINFFPRSVYVHKSFFWYDDKKTFNNNVISHTHTHDIIITIQYYRTRCYYYYCKDRALARGDRVRRPGRPCPGACALPGGQ